MINQLTLSQHSDLDNKFVDCFVFKIERHQRWVVTPWVLLSWAHFVEHVVEMQCEPGHLFRRGCYPSGHQPPHGLSELAPMTPKLAHHHLLLLLLLPCALQPARAISPRLLQVPLKLQLFETKHQHPLCSPGLPRPSCQWVPWRACCQSHPWLPHRSHRHHEQQTGGSELSHSLQTLGMVSRKKLGRVLPPPLIWTKSKRTATFFGRPSLT